VKRIDTLETLLGVAEEQGGLVTRAQARTLRVSDEDLARLSGSDLERLDHGVWRIRWFPSVPFGEIRSLHLSLDPDRPPAERLRAPKIFVSGRSAARLYRAGSLPASVHEFTLPGGGRSRRRVKLHHAEVPEWCVIEGLSVTTPGRTLADLVCSYTASPDHLGHVAADLLDRGYARPGELAKALGPVAEDGLGRANGRAALTALLGAADRVPSRSPDQRSPLQVRS